MENELKKCPFCGRTPYLNEIPPHTHILPGMPDCEGECFVECNCTCAISAKDKEEAIEKWNKRVDEHSDIPCFPYRLTEDDPQSNTGTILNYAFAKNREVTLRFANGKSDVKICDLIAEADKRHCECDSDDILEGACFECETDKCIYGICYILAVQAAELRERLKAYEDCFDMPTMFEDYLNKERSNKGKSEMKNTVTEQQVNNLIENAEINVTTVYDKVTIVSAKLPNGFVITESSACVDPANYDEEVGKKICLDRIKDKILELEGYALSKKLSEKQNGEN